MGGKLTSGSQPMLSFTGGLKVFESLESVDPSRAASMNYAGIGVHKRH